MCIYPNINVKNSQEASTDDSGFYTCTAGNILGETVSFELCGNICKNVAMCVKCGNMAMCVRKCKKCNITSNYSSSSVTMQHNKMPQLN